MKFKQTIKYATIFIAGAIFATAGSAYAGTAYTTVKALLIPNWKINVNGKPLDSTPISYNSTTYVPLRKAAEAVGGNVSVDGQTINIVTNSHNEEDFQGQNVSTPTSPTEEETDPTTSNDNFSDVYPIEGKVLYSWEDVYANLLSTQHEDILADVINGNSIIKFKGKNHIRIKNVDFCYDQNEKMYLTKNFLLSFLESTDLTGLKQYMLVGQNVTQISQ